MNKYHIYLDLIVFRPVLEDGFREHQKNDKGKDMCQSKRDGKGRR